MDDASAAARSDAFESHESSPATPMGNALPFRDEPWVAPAAAPKAQGRDAPLDGLPRLVPFAPLSPPPAADVEPIRIVEALLFAADTPLSAARLSELGGGLGVREVRELVGQLNERYAAAGLAFRVDEIAGGYQMMTLPEFEPWLARLNRQRIESRLSAAAMETLAIIAYRQPIIRADVEAIRGVACGEMIGRLRELGLVRVAGRAEIVGRPMLYATTRKFLDVFGLADLDDLPPMEALSFRPASKPAAVTPAEAAAGPAEAVVAESPGAGDAARAVAGA